MSVEMAQELGTDGWRAAHPADSLLASRLTPWIVAATRQVRELGRAGKCCVAKVLT